MQTIKEMTLRAPKIKKISKKSLTTTGGCHMPAMLRKHVEKSTSKAKSTTKA